MKKVKDKEILICECHSIDHCLSFFYEEEDGHPLVFFNVHLNKRPLWERIKYGIRYIFGKQSRYGAFDEFILNPDDRAQIQNLANYLGKIKDPADVS
jgi:hypothetical protein